MEVEASTPLRSPKECRPSVDASGEQAMETRGRASVTWRSAQRSPVSMFASEIQPGGSRSRPRSRLSPSLTATSTTTTFEAGGSMAVSSPSSTAGPTPQAWRSV